MKPIKDEVVVITGTSRGLGKFLALHFIQSGNTVYGCSRGKGAINSPNYKHSSIDLSKEEEVRTWVRSIKKEAPKISYLICNASIVQSALFLSVTPGDLFQNFLNSNVTSVFYTVREFSKIMARNGYGRIVLISSTMVAARGVGTSIYSSTKAFTTQMIKVLSKELAARNVTCNVVAPGLMETESSKELSGSEKWKSEVLGLQTIPRAIEYTEISNVIDFYFSPSSGAVTGQVINIGLVD